MEVALPEFIFELNDATIVFDGKNYASVDRTAAEALKAVCEARGVPLGISTRFNQKPKRIIQKLPPVLRPLMQPVGKKGYVYAPLCPCPS
jgi:hypothetical protein